MKNNNPGVMLPKSESVETDWEVGGTESEGETSSSQIDSPSSAEALEEIKRPMTPGAIEEHVK